MLVGELYVRWGFSGLCTVTKVHSLPGTGASEVSLKQGPEDRDKLN